MIDACNSTNIQVCLDCGQPLHIMYNGQYKNIDGLIDNTVFHCESCGADWESEINNKNNSSVFKRKYWG